MLGPVRGSIEVGDLPQLYPWPDRPWLRVCLVSSLDGAVNGPDGLSGSISSPVDRAVLAAIRTNADAYLVGAGTVRAEGYRAVTARPEAREDRQRRGQRPSATLVVVSASCRFDWSATDFQRSDQSPLVLTTTRSTPADRAAAHEAGCEVIVAGSTRVDLPSALVSLRSRGLRWINAEGGPGLVAELVGLDLVDEVDLTVSPTLTGATRPGGGAPGLQRLRLEHVVEDDGYLFTRYVRAGRD